MSLIITGKTAYAILIASDRRITNTLVQNNIEKQTPQTDAEQKTVVFGDRFAVSYCGNANIKGLPTSAHLFRAANAIENSTTTFEIANGLIQYWKDNNIQNKPALLVSGYNDGKPSIIEVKANNDEIVDHFENEDSYGIVYHGESDVCKALLGIEEIRFSLMRPKDMIALMDLLIKTTANLQALQDRMQTVSADYDLLQLTPTGHRWLIPPIIAPD